jgi:hypothetical protein
MCKGLIFNLLTSGVVLVIFIADFVLLLLNSNCLIEGVSITIYMLCYENETRFCLIAHRFVHRGGLRLDI